MTSGSEMYYLVERNNATGVTNVRDFRLSDRDGAFSAYFARERETRSYSDDPETGDVEVVLIVASSIRALQLGYPHLFSAGDRAERQERFIEEVDELLAV